MFIYLKCRATKRETDRQKQEEIFHFLVIFPMPTILTTGPAWNQEIRQGLKQPSSAPTQGAR